MSRQIPAVFTGKDTYGVETDQNRDRLPVVDPTARGTLADILVGGDSYAIRICLAAICSATDGDDIAKLVIGALIDASGISASTAKLLNPSGTDYKKPLKEWTVAALYGAVSDDSAGEVPETGDGTEQAADTQRTTTEKPFPSEHLPGWMQELEISSDDYLLAASADPMELAAYAGILAFAIGKQPTPENLEAFNQRRRNAISQFIVSGEMKIFVDDSKFLSLDVLGKVNRAFNSYTLDRAIVLSAIVDADSPLVSGKKRMFYVMFRLSIGVGLNPLLIIVRYARKYPHFYAHFPDLETEYHAAAHALQRFHDVVAKRKMYLKLIFGSAYVPIGRNDVDALLGVAVFALQQTEPSLANYAGGTLSVPHREKLIHLLSITAPVEEDVPETAE